MALAINHNRVSDLPSPETQITEANLGSHYLWNVAYTRTVWVCLYLCVCVDVNKCVRVCSQEVLEFWWNFR